jgi:chromosome partitioning protein
VSKKRTKKAAGAPAAHDRVRVIAIANQKGGVGKSTTAVSLGAALADDGHRVLVIDLDPQGNASTGMGIRHEAREVTVYDVLVADAPVEAAIVPTPVERLHALPSTIDLAGAEIELVSQFSRELKLRKALEPLVKQASYDYVLLDCPPSLGLLTVNALAAARELIVPIQCEYYALEGLGQLLRNVRLVQQNINPNLQLTGIVMTMFDSRTKLSEQVVQEVQRFFGERVYDVIIPRTVRLSEAPGFGQPITVYDPKSKGAECYRQLASEVASKPPPSEPMPSFDDLPTVVVAPIAPQGFPVADETIRDLPTVHGVMESDEEGADPEPTTPVPRASSPTVPAPGPNGSPQPARPPPPAPRVDRPPPSVRAQDVDEPVEPEREAAAWLGELAAEAEAESRGPTSTEVLAEVASQIEIEDEDVWEATDEAADRGVATRAEEPPAPQARQARQAEGSGEPQGAQARSRLVVIDDAAEDRLSEVAFNPPPRAGDPADEEVQPVAKIGATLEEEGAHKKRWRLFRKGGA